MAARRACRLRPRRAAPPSATRPMAPSRHRARTAYACGDHRPRYANRKGERVQDGMDDERQRVRELLDQRAARSRRRPSRRRGGTQTSPPLVAITTTTSGATIRYTLDGSTPTVASPVFVYPFLVQCDDDGESESVQGRTTPRAPWPRRPMTWTHRGPTATPTDRACRRMVCDPADGDDQRRIGRNPALHHGRHRSNHLVDDDHIRQHHHRGEVADRQGARLGERRAIRARSGARISSLPVPSLVAYHTARHSRGMGRCGPGARMPSISWASRPSHRR